MPDTRWPDAAPLAKRILRLRRENTSLEASSQKIADKRTEYANSEESLARSIDGLIALTQDARLRAIHLKLLLDHESILCEDLRRQISDSRLSQMEAQQSKKLAKFVGDKLEAAAQQRFRIAAQLEKHCPIIDRRLIRQRKKTVNELQGVTTASEKAVVAMSDRRDLISLALSDMPCQ